MLKELIDKFIFKGLDSARDAGTRRIVARFSRGNVTIQNGRYLTQSDFDKLRQQGDKAWDHVRARFFRTAK